MDTPILPQKAKGFCIHCGAKVSPQHNRCAACASERRDPKTPDDYRAAAEKCSYKWLGPYPTDTTKKTWWQCPNGHQWEAPYNNVRKGSGCRECTNKRIGDARRKYADDYHALAKEKGLLWLGPEVQGAKYKTKWECPCGNVFEAVYNNIQQGKGCPKCAEGKRTKKRRQYTEEHYHALASQRGFVWCGGEVTSVRANTTWQCANGHRWTASYDTIRKGHGCANCGVFVNGRLASKPQIKLSEMLGGVLNYRVGRSAVDVAVIEDGIKIAVEYDSWYWHGGTVGADKKDSAKLIASGWKVLRIKSRGIHLPLMADLEAALQLLRGEMVYTEIVMADWGMGGFR